MTPRRIRGATILVTDAGRGSAVSIIRSLGRQGCRVIAADSNPDSLGFRSRFASERLVYPSPVHDAAAFVGSIEDACARWNVDLVIPVTDAAMLPLSECRTLFDGRYPVAMPGAAALRRVIDKGQTFELARSLGVPVPRSVVVDADDLGSMRYESLGWPIVLKPRSSRVYRVHEAIEAFEVSYANDASELERGVRAFGGRVEIVAQEYCRGVGHGVGFLLHQGRALAAFQHRRLHEVPLTGGPSALRESVPLDPVLYQHSLRLMAALEWTGLAMVEFKVGPSGPMLMEVNGRVWGSLPLAVMSGVDFPRLLVELYLNGPPPIDVEPLTRYRVGVRARSLALDLTWIALALRGERRYPFLGTPGRAQAIAGLLGLADPRCRLDLMSIADLGPSIAEIPQMLGKLRRKSARPG